MQTRRVEWKNSFSWKLGIIRVEYRMELTIIKTSKRPRCDRYNAITTKNYKSLGDLSSFRLLFLMLYICRTQQKLPAQQRILGNLTLRVIKTSRIIIVSYSQNVQENSWKQNSSKVSSVKEFFPQYKNMQKYIVKQKCTKSVNRGMFAILRSEYLRVNIWGS